MDKKAILKILRKFLAAVILIVITAICAHLIPKYFNQTQFLDYEFDIQNISDDTKHDIDIKFDTVAVNNLYRIEFELYNFNDFDVENIPIYIDMHGQKDGQAKVLYHEEWGNGESKESIEQIAEIEKSDYENKCGVRMGYNIKNGRKGNKDFPILKILFFVDAEEISDIKVFVNKGGYQERQFEFGSYYTSDQNPDKYEDFWFIFYLIFIASAVGFVLIVVINWLDPEDKKLKERKLEILPEVIQYIKNTQEEPTSTDVLNKMNFLEKELRWKKSTKWQRFFWGIRKPTQE